MMIIIYYVKHRTEIDTHGKVIFNRIAAPVSNWPLEAHWQSSASDSWHRDRRKEAGVGEIKIIEFMSFTVHIEYRGRGIEPKRAVPA